MYGCEFFTMKTRSNKEPSTDVLSSNIFKKSEVDNSLEKLDLK